MARQAKGLVRFRQHLDTIMEQPEIQDNNMGSCFYSVSPQTQVVSSTRSVQDFVRDSQRKETLRRKKIALISTQIDSRTEQKQPKSWSDRKCSQFSEPLQADNCKNEKRKRIEKENNCEAKQQYSRKLREWKQVRVLFPDFFSSASKTYFVAPQSNLYDEYQREMDMVKNKTKEDPLIRSWMNLFGGNSSCIRT